MKAAVGEERQGRAPFMARNATSFAIEDRPSQLLLRGKRLRVASHETIEWSIESYMSTFVGGNRLLYITHRDRFSEHGLEFSLVFGNAPDFFLHFLGILHPHLDCIEDGILGLIFQRSLTAVPKLQTIEGRIKHSRCVASTEFAIHADRGRQLIGEAFIGIVATRTHLFVIFR